jgi:hypothetical protein
VGPGYILLGVKFRIALVMSVIANDEI